MKAEVEVSTITTTRKSKQFWAVTDDHLIKFVTGWECPASEGMWWVPELGYSMSVGIHLFISKQAAKNKALREIQEEREDLTKSERELEKL
jgi:hypothetical protein